LYAVIRAGGKQHRVAQGDVIEVERAGEPDAKLEFTPLLVVGDDGRAHTDPSSLAKARVTAKVVGETRGSKVRVFKYRNKTGYRRLNGHRQNYSRIEISDIKLGTRRTGRSRSSKSEESKNGT
jgi:large subunit ribosomal protein L21